MRSYTREEYLALIPSQYLPAGFADPAALRGEYATAACIQLIEAGLSPQELAFTVEAVRLSLPLHAGPSAPRQAAEAVAEALETVARMIRQPNNEGLTRWLEQCAAQVREASDVDALLLHLQAVLRQYAALASVQPSASSSSPQPPW